MAKVTVKVVYYCYRSRSFLLHSSSEKAKDIYKHFRKITITLSVTYKIVRIFDKYGPDGNMLPDIFLFSSFVCSSLSILSSFFPSDLVQLPRHQLCVPPQLNLGRNFSLFPTRSQFPGKHIATRLILKTENVSLFSFQP